MAITIEDHWLRTYHPEGYVPGPHPMYYDYTLEQWYKKDGDYY